jgi:hypothetical protein
LRVLHLPDLVGGHPTALSEGERMLGAQSKVLSYAASPFGYAADIALTKQDGNLVQRWTERFAAFLRIRKQFDVFHFNFGRSLLTANSGRLLLADLPFYPSDAVKVMTFQGSDARLAYDASLTASLDEEARRGQPIGAFADPRAVEARNRIIRKTIDKAARHCSRFFALNPDLMDFLPREMTEFFPYAVAPPPGMSAPLQSWQGRTRPLHFVHLSTNRVLKGTGLIESALERASSGLGITYEIIHRQPRETALARLRTADVVVDQMVLGWYGAAAVEALSLGKPVITHISERQAALAPQALAADLPFIQADHLQLDAVIRSLVKDREQLDPLAAKGRAFAARWHDPLTAAGISLSGYRRLARAKGG